MGYVLWVLPVQLQANTEANTEVQKRVSLGNKHSARTGGCSAVQMCVALWSPLGSLGLVLHMPGHQEGSSGRPSEQMCCDSVHVCATLAKSLNLPGPDSPSVWPCRRGGLLRAPSRPCILGGYLASGGPYCSWRPRELQNCPRVERGPYYPVGRVWQELIENRTTEAFGDDVGSIGAGICGGTPLVMFSGCALWF